MAPTTRVTKRQVTHLVPGVRCQVQGARKGQGASLEVKNGGSAVVEHSTHNLKMEGFNPGETGKEKNGKIFFPGTLW